MNFKACFPDVNFAKTYLILFLESHQRYATCYNKIIRKFQQRRHATEKFHPKLSETADPTHR